MDHARLHDTILKLYRGCRDVPYRKFKEWAMELAQQAVDFDSGFWGTSDIVSDDFSSTFLFRQPKEMIENYCRVVRISGDPLAQAVTHAAGRTVAMNDNERNPEFSSDLIAHIEMYGMHGALCTCHTTETTRITSFVSFYRSEANKPFSEAERRTKELLVPHMVEAMRLNLFSYLNDGKPRRPNALAICDAKGSLYETTQGFPSVMHTAFPDWFGPHLDLPFVALNPNSETRWSENSLKFRASPCGDLFLIKVTPENHLDRLSPRQREIAQLLVQGRTYKDIARDLDISPSTVTNHVNQIYTRLEVDKRESLIKLVRKYQ